MGTVQRRVLVTGALGQIGMELLQALSVKHGSENVIATDIRDSVGLEDTEIKFIKFNHRAIR